MRTNSKKSGSVALLLLLCLMAQFCAGTLAAATDEEKTEPQEQTAVEKKPGLFRDLWEDEKDIWTSPFHMKGRQFLTAGIVLLTTGILVTQDEAIARNVMQLSRQAPLGPSCQQESHPTRRGVCLGDRRLVCRRRPADKGYQGPRNGHHGAGSHAPQRHWWFNSANSWPAGNGPTPQAEMTTGWGRPVSRNIFKRPRTISTALFSRGMRPPLSAWPRSSPANTGTMAGCRLFVMRWPAW